jgi:hypothetical protein
VALALGGAALGAGALVLLAALVLVLGLLMPVWLAALLVGGCFTAAGAVVFLRARAKLSEVQLMPERTIQNVQRDVAAVKGAAT